MNYSIVRVLLCFRRSAKCKNFSTFKLSPLILELPPSGIREIMSDANELERKHNAKVIHLEVGQPNFNTPKHITDACISALSTGKTAYVPNAGINELREEIARYYNSKYPKTSTSVENIVVTTGSMLSLFSLYMALLQPGDECLIPFPGFPNYQQAISLVHGKPVVYTCLPKNNYLPTVDNIASQITPKTKCILLCNPGNPTGAAYTHELYASIIKLAKQHNLFVISDEIYSEISFDSPHVSAMDFLDDNGDNNELSNIAVISGVSKAYAMTGFRVGWARTNPEVAYNLSKLQEPLVSCGVPFTQYAAIEALRGPQSCVAEMTQEYKTRRDSALRILESRGHESAYIPGGAFYLPLDISRSGLKSKDFAKKLLFEKKVAVAPGSAFDTSYQSRTCFYSNQIDPDCGKSAGMKKQSNIRHKVSDFDKLINSFCRVSLANSKENVDEGIKRICDFMDSFETKK